MNAPKFWLTPTPRTPANEAIAYALDRFAPSPEPHEVEHFRDCLRERGFDVVAVEGGP